MKKKLLIVVALMLLTTVALSSCAVLNNVLDFFNGIFAPTVELTDEALNTEKLIDFKDGANAEVLFESDGWSNGDVFNVVWKKHNVFYENDIMRLGITEEKATAWLDEAEIEFDYTAGEARTQNYYHYGDYEVSMKPSANPGTASTFFVCTGPYDLKDGVPNPHDEIDIEFLGNDTTHVQFNFFVDGKGGNEYMYDLGFDASEEFHTYGFRWEPDAITWFVDGEPAYKVTTDTSVAVAGNVKRVDKLPSTAGRILTNYWCGNERAWAWMGEYKGAIKDQGTEYQWIGTSAEGAPLNPPVAPPIDDTTEIDWSVIDPIAPTFETAEKYIVAIDGNNANVTYANVGGSDYKPIEMDVTEASAGKNFVYLKVTNNGTETVNVRVNMFDPTLTGNNKATNISATMNGESVFTDLDWGGSFFDIPAGETAELVVNFGVGGNKLQLMIDSSRNDTVLRSGDITVEDIKFAVVGEVDVPHSCKDEDGNDICDECGEGMIVPPSPIDPESGNLTLDFGDFTTTIGGNVTDGYGVNVDENNNINVVYTNIVGNSYKNIWANVAAIAGTKTAFSVKVTNKGEATVKFRIDIESETQVNANTTCCNLSASKNGESAFTDLEWGGSIFEIAAGETATLEVVYEAANKPTNVKIMIDSCQYDDTASHAGELTISDLSFSGEYIPGDNPITPPAPTYEYKDIYAEFVTTNPEYSINIPDPANPWVNSANITFTNVTNSWQNVNIYVEDKSEDCTVFTMKVKNNGENQVNVWAQIKNSADVELVSQNKNIAPGAEEIFNISFEGRAQMVYFFIDSTHEATQGETSGDITISELKIGKVVSQDDDDNGQEDFTPTYADLWGFWASGAEYTNTVANDGKSVTISYNGLVGSYQCVGCDLQTFAQDNNKAVMSITNNGSSVVTVLAKVQGASGVDIGECRVEIAAGDTVTVTVNYSATEASGVGKQILLHIDSMHGGETAYSGNVTIGNVYFTTAE